jgi:PAS domain S-box-containing protein
MPTPIKVLIVEDTPADADLMVLNLSRADYKVDWLRVDNERDFLTALDTSIDLILSDWNLPQFSGSRALQLTREHGIETPFIIVSGAIGELAAVDALHRGAADYLLKDRMERLGQAVHNALEQKQNQEKTRQAQQALVASEAELRALFSSLRDIVLVLDRNGVYKKVAPTNPDLLVRPAIELVGLSLMSIFPPEQAEEFGQMIRNVLDTRQTSSIEYELYVQDRKVWFEASISPMTADEVIWVARDITERKRAETERQTLMDITRGLATSENLQEYLSLVHHAIAKVIFADNFFVVLKNKNTDLFEEVYSVDKYDPPSPPSSLEKSISAYVFRNSEPVLLTQRYFDELAARGEVEMVGADSRSWLGVPLITSKETIGVMVVQDYEMEDCYSERDKEFLVSIAGQVAQIVERKQTEAAIQESEERYRSLFEDSPVPIWEEDFSLVKHRLDELRAAGVTDFQQYCMQHPDEFSGGLDLVKLLDVNKAALKLFGAVSKKEMDINLRNYIDDAHSKYVLEELINIANGMTQFEMEIINKTLDGRSLNLFMNWAVVPGHAEDFSKVIVSKIDITDRKRSEVVIKRKSLLQEKMAALGRELTATLDLETIYRTAQKFLSSMIDCPNYGITMFNAQQNVLNVVYLVTDGQLIDPTSLSSLTYDPRNVKSGRSAAIASKKPVIMQDLAATRKAAGGMLVGSEREPETAIYTPMIVEGQALGLIELQSYEKDAYTEEDGEWLSVVANQIGLCIRNSQLLATLQKRVVELTALHTIESAVTAHANAQETLEISLEQIVKILRVDAASILSFNKQTKSLDLVSGIGFLISANITPHVDLANSVVGKVVKTRKTIHGEAGEAGLEFLKEPDWVEQGFVSYTCVPLIVNSEVIGVCEVFQRSAMAKDEEWLRTLETLAGQVALVIDHLKIFEDLQQANTDLLQAYDATIVGWSRAMDLRDEETENHTTRVTELTVRMGEHLGLSGERIIQLRRGALLHDIGKLGIPDGILLKPGKLTDEERANMQRHPRLAFEMLNPIEYLRPALDIPYCHHERWDGSGYPQGLKGEEIPFDARLFMIADVYDALISDRPYRKAWTPERALEHIREESGKHFDPRAVDAFFSLLHTGRLSNIF